MLRPRGAAILVSVVLLAYTLARAARVGFVHDESYTYLLAVDQPIDRVLGLAFGAANNHPLNSWAMYLARAAFGTSELALRLPNLLAHVLYLASAMLFAGRMRSRTAAWGTFVVLTMSPFQLGFFGLARGYGLGLGFAMASLWLAARSLEEADEKRALASAAASIACATLGVFANDVYLYSYAGLARVCS